MAYVMYIRTRQRVVTEFVTTESSGPIAIHTQIKIVYGADTTDVNSDTGSVTLRAVKRTLVTGPTALEQTSF
jgi:hypothetical protein